jgi:hypothetical protein
VPASRRFRLSALVAGIAVVASAVLPSIPAYADDEPTSTPTPVVSETPAPESTGDPAPEVTNEPEAEPEAEPTTEPTPTEAPEPAATTATLTGSFVELADHDTDASLPKGVRLFNATGVGYLLIASGDLKTNGDVTLTIAIPAGVTEDGLVDYSTQVAPLTLIDVEAAKQYSAMVNQTPNFSATHKIYAVLVTPSNMADSAASANQTQAKVAAAVAHADDFWNQQSSGSIRFSLAGTTAWYKGGATCASGAGSTSLWNQAKTAAQTQLGYVAGPNTHLVMFFPSNADCEGPIGLATVERSTNRGGLAWVVGTDSTIGKATLAHELGHNLSLGHADWLDCDQANPQPGFYANVGCDLTEYGDLTDIMGFGQSDHSGGALSAPQAIRASIWPSSAYKLAPKGTTEYTLKPVSGNSGLRSVIVEDRQGINYFVEFRNYTGEDTRATAECEIGEACVVNTPGVRILRLAQDEDLFKGMPGDDSLLLGRTVGGVPRIDYKKNESFSTNGISIKVTALSSGSAVVTIGRNFTAGNLDTPSFFPAVTYDESGELRVGDTWGVILGAGMITDKVQYQWYRNGVAISGATKQFYTFTNSDYLKTIKVKLTVTSKGYQTAYGSDTLGTVQKAVSTGSGTVTVPNATPLKAVTSGLPWGSKLAYQWWRDGAKIADATASTYTPTSADRGHQVKVVVTPTSAGNIQPPIESPTEDYGLVLDGGVFGITGTEKVANTLSAPVLNYRSNDDGPVTVQRAFTWYRSGVVIAGATASTYALVGADAGKTITVKVTASAPGYVAHSAVTSPTGLIARGTIQGSKVGPGLTKTGSVTLTAALPVGSITESGVAYKYQWYRSVPAGTPELPITGAIASSYTLTSADYNKLVWVKVAVSKPGYTSEVLGSARLNYSVIATDTPVITGTARVGETLTANALTYTPVAPSSAPTYTWLRDGVVVSTGTSASYLLKSADYGTKISVRVTATAAGYLSLKLLSPATAKVTKGVFAGTLTATVTQNVRVLTALPSGLTPTPKYTYQWLRSGSKIPLATASTYTLTADDYGKQITVRVVASRTNYTSPSSFTPVAALYSILASKNPVIAGEVRKGSPLSVTLPTYTVDGATTVPTIIKYQWLRDGVKIVGATGATYTPVTLDLDTAISVTVTAGYVDGARSLLPSIRTSSKTQKIGKYTLAGWNAQTNAAIDHVGLTLTARSGVAGTGITEAGTKVTYQWYRSGSAIVGATSRKYTLTSLDGGKTVHVRVTTSKELFTSVAKSSVPQSFTVTPSAPASITLLGGGKVGTQLALSLPSYSVQGDSVVPTMKYTWMRNGVAIPGIPTTQDTYTLTPSDLGKRITVRVAASAGTEWLPSIVITAATPVIAAGTIVAQDVAPSTSLASETMTLTASYAGTITSPATVVTGYQWLRNGLPISGATAATYKLSSADNGTTTSVRAVLSAPGYAALPLTASTAVAHPSIVGTGSLTINDTTPKTQQKLSRVSTLTFTADGTLDAWVPLAEQVTYKWYVNGVAVAGATKSSFTVPETAVGKKVTVRITVTKPGNVPFTKLSAATGAVALAPGFAG